MTTITRSIMGLLLAWLSLAGCAGPAPDQAKSKQTAPAPKKTAGPEDIEASLAQLSPADRKLADEQRFCAVETSNLLGSMGVPYKVMINGQPVFLCCDGCETRAKAHADRTLAKVEQLREKTKNDPPGR